MGDSVVMIIVLLIGGLLMIMYGENIGVLVIIRVFSVFVIGGVGVIVLCFGFIGKVLVLISFVLFVVMGGVFFLFFGIIVFSGLRMLIDNNIDYENKRNLIIIFVIFVIGVGGVFI